MLESYLSACALLRGPTTRLPYENGDAKSSTFPKDTKSEVACFFLRAISFRLSAKSGSYEYYFLKSSDMNRQGTDCEEDSLATGPVHLAIRMIMEQFG